MDLSQKSNTKPLSTRLSLQLPSILLIEDDISMRSMMIDFFTQKNSPSVQHQMVLKH